MIYHAVKYFLSIDHNQLLRETLDKTLQKLMHSSKQSYESFPGIQGKIPAITSPQVRRSDFQILPVVPVCYLFILFGTGFSKHYPIYRLIHKIGSKQDE